MPLRRHVPLGSVAKFGRWAARGFLPSCAVAGARDASDDVAFGSIAVGVRTVFRASPLTFVAIFVVRAVRGLAPVFAALLTGRAVAAIPAALAAGGLHGGGHRLAVAIVEVAAIYGANQVVDAFMFPVEEGWSMMVQGR